MFISGRVLEINRLSENYFEGLIRLLEDPGRKPRPFQFVMIWIPRVDLMPMSVADYDERLLKIIFKVRGEGTKRLSEKPVFVGVNGFYGRGFDLSESSKILFVAGGSGVAPLPYLARLSEERRVEIDVIWGVKRSSELFDLRRVTPYRSVKRVYLAAEDCLSREIYCGMATELFEKIYNSREWDLVVVSGPRDMLKRVCLYSREREKIYLNLESHMKCGIGFCGSCVLKPLPIRLCVDGPVLRCDIVAEYLEREN
ncbi:MAG: hypothetical protein ABWJ42_06165 [Sulfolobales archaeon]